MAYHLGQVYVRDVTFFYIIMYLFISPNLFCNGKKSSDCPFLQNKDV